MTVGFYTPNFVLSFQRRRNPIHISIGFLLRRNDKPSQLLYCNCIRGVLKPTVIKYNMKQLLKLSFSLLIIRQGEFAQP